MGVIGQFLKAHPKHLLAVFSAYVTWAWERECGTFYGVDVLAFIQRYAPSVICAQVQHAGIFLAAVFLGMGIQDQDEYFSNFLRGAFSKKPLGQPAPEPVKP